MNNSTKKLLNGTMIYFIGNALTQILSLALLRFVTGKISAEEYGIYNLVVTITNLVIPFVTLQISDAIFKFLIKAKDNDEKIKCFTIAIYISLVAIALIVVGIFITNTFFIKLPHPELIALYMATTSFFVMYHRVVRALGKNKVYVIGNLIKTIIYLGLEIFLIYVFDLGVEALFLSIIISNFICLIFLEIGTRAFKYFRFNKFDGRMFWKMCKFSLPLIPNAVCWWLTSSINAIVISARCGLDMNGIYTVANKFSSVLAMVTTVFSLSWQESAVSEYGTKEFKVLFTETFNTYVKGLFSVLILLLPFMSIVLPIMIDESYYAAIQYAPFLLFASALSALSGFLAQIFIAKSDNIKTLLSNAVGMVLNLVAVLVLVSYIGLWAAVIGTILADLSIVVVRIIILRKEFAKGINVLGILLTILLLGISVFTYLYLGNIINIIWFVIAMGLVVILNFKLIKDLFSVIKGRLFKRAKHE